MNPIAVVSDIHGNFWALQVVVEDIQQQGIARVRENGREDWAVALETGYVQKP